MDNENVVRYLVCGASAGLAVDLGLYPLDTLKTRLQSKQGFVAAGGFKNIYRGMGSVAIGSAPGAAIFFLTYRSMQKTLGAENSAVHALSASVGEVMACLVRVPTELVKQRSQASNGKTTISSVAREILKSNGIFGFYRGYLSTICREIPFAFIEFPIWEGLKKSIAMKKGRDCSPLEGAACGSLAGSVAAGITTPLDVAKTRIMLSKAKVPPTILSTLKEVGSTGGVPALFSGLLPRTVWMAIGGFVFFGAYETVLAVTQLIVPEKDQQECTKTH